MNLAHSLYGRFMSWRGKRVWELLQKPEEWHNPHATNRLIFDLYRIRHSSGIDLWMANSFYGFNLYLEDCGKVPVMSWFDRRVCYGPARKIAKRLELQIDPDGLLKQLDCRLRSDSAQ